MDPLERFAAGDDDAFETVFRQYQGSVYRWIVRLVRNPAVAEDLTVDTFWSIYRHRNRFDAQRPFGPWARRIATRIAIDYLRSGGRSLDVAGWQARSCNTDPLLEAELRGLIQEAFLLPSWFLLIVVAALLLGHFTGSVPARVERVIVFPMAVVPNLWGLWNLLYVSREMHERVPIGVFGALLPLVLVPVGVTLASVLDLGLYAVRQAAFVLPIAMAIYYLAWKYAVAFFNRVVGLR